jgi:hypothetical protein
MTSSFLSLGRTLVAAVAVSGLLLAGLPDAASSQGQPPGVPPGKLKHDKIVPPGPPWSAPSPAVASGLILTPGFEPTPAFTEAVASLREGRFLMATPVPGEAQRAVFDVFADRGDPNGTALVAALTSRGNEGARDECVRLVRSVRALTVVDGQLPAAVEAFNALVDASSDAFLADPAPEFLAVHAFLGTLTREAMAGTPGAR